MQFKRKVIALESRLRKCCNVATLGVRTNFNEYPPRQQAEIRKADIVYYPSTFYADLFDSIGKQTFPSYQTYKCAQDKIKQTALFELLGIPHPRTRVFYGKRHKQTILQYFGFPFPLPRSRADRPAAGGFI